VTGAYLPADVYVRTLRMMGEEVLFVCGTDEHGVAITIGAEQEGTPYAAYVARWRAGIKQAFDAFGIEFDIWSGTSICPEHEARSQGFFRRLDERGWLQRKTSAQLYCTRDRMFLADRYVAGTCTNCGFEEARGDECPRCGTWLDPLEMARKTKVSCKICGTRPEERDTLHWYLDLPKIRDAGFGAWFEGHPWKPNVSGFIGNMLSELHPRPITRDMSWGVPVPADRAAGETGKVLYVWFDAPIGYVSFTEQWAREQGRPSDWERWWRSPETRLVHFIGKDNIPFHCLVFPSMLYALEDGWTMPWQVPANEFYNLQGGKFSTSRNWTIPLDDFVARHDAEAARFHLIASMPETADSEWRWEDFQATNNSLLADAIGNLATRVLKFIEKNAGGVVPALDPNHEIELDRRILGECGEYGDPGQHVLEFRFRRAAEELIRCAHVGNKFVNDLAPWTLRKTDPPLAASVLNTACQWIAWLARWMAPFVPKKAQALWEMLGQTTPVALERWPGIPVAGAWRIVPAGQKLGVVTGLFPKIEDAVIQAEVAALEARRPTV